ncbi:MAG: hypothetical protein JXR07_10725 [Reichenbachiella sp.]
MKRITLLVIACTISTISMAHEVPVPHAHSGYIHGIVPFLIYILLPVSLGIGIVKLYAYLKKAKQV